MAQILREIGFDDPVLLAAALLHDVVENSTVTPVDAFTLEAYVDRVALGRCGR